MKSSMIVKSIKKTSSPECGGADRGSRKLKKSRNSISEIYMMRIYCKFSSLILCILCARLCSMRTINFTNESHFKLTDGQSVFMSTSRNLKVLCIVSANIATFENVIGIKVLRGWNIAGLPTLKLSLNLTILFGRISTSQEREKTFKFSSYKMKLRQNG